MPQAAFPIPSGLFGWAFQIFSIPETEIIGKVGLDAIQYLRFLEMCIKIILVLLLLLLGILLPVNYFAGGNATPNIESATQVFNTTSESLAFFAINNISDGSNLLWIHVIFSGIVTAWTYYMLYANYKQYAETFNEYMCDRLLHSASERIQYRTILIKNLKHYTGNPNSIREWVETLGLGEIDSVSVNGGDGFEIWKILEKHKIVTRKIESAYMSWASSIYKQLGPPARRFNTLSSNEKSMLHHTKLEQDVEVKKWSIIHKCRPEILIPGRSGLLKRDVIKHYNRINNDLKEELIYRRIHPSPQKVVGGELDHSKNYSISAFITFKDVRSCLIAKQLLLQSEMGISAIEVLQAPPHKEVIWGNLTLPLAERFGRQLFISILALVISITWIIPTSLVSSLTDLPRLASNPMFTEYVEYLVSRPLLYSLVSSVGPPLIIQTAVSCLPYLFQCQSTLIFRFIWYARI